MQSDPPIAICVLDGPSAVFEHGYTGAFCSLTEPRDWRTNGRKWDVAAIPDRFGE
jgi:hypothetical protein